MEELVSVHPLVAKMRKQRAAALQEMELFQNSADFTEEESDEWDKCTLVDKQFFLEILSNGFQKTAAARRIGVSGKPGVYVSNMRRKYPALCRFAKRLNSESGLAAMKHRSLSSKTEVASQLDHLQNAAYLQCVTVEDAIEAGVDKLVKKVETQWHEREEKMVRVVTEWHNPLDYIKEYNKMMGNYAPQQVEQKTQTIGADGLPTNNVITLRIEGAAATPDVEIPVDTVDAADFILGQGDSHSNIAVTKT